MIFTCFGNLCFGVENLFEKLRFNKVVMTEPKPWFPLRIADALRSAKNFGEYRDNRVFRFLRAFAGPKDILGERLVEKAKRENLRVEVVALDKKKDGVDLSQDEPYATVLEQTKEGEFDGAHSGFPRNTFSVARWNPVPGQPPPLRSGKEIYGLAGNSKEMQQKADEGTLLATRSVDLMEAQLQSPKRRQTPPVATLENPPGDLEKGSAWMLPEVMKFMKGQSIEVAEFNTCAYMTSSRRHKKPGKFGGRLAGLSTLSKPCRCPAWVIHEALVGAHKTSAAAEYPFYLADAYAELVVRVWKKQLQLEWWRNQTDLTSQELEMLQVAERKRKREESGNTTNRAKRITPQETNKSDEAIPGDAMDDNIDKEVKEPGAVKPSKKQIRELENKNSLGGMRDPRRAVDKLTQVRRTGEEVAEMWKQFIEEFPEALVTAQLYGSAVCKPIDEVTMAWRQKLSSYLGEQPASGVSVRENWEFVSPLQSGLWDAWHRKSGDPEKFIGTWAREGCPMGMEKEIPTCGVFPEVEEDDELENVPEMEAIQQKENYKSMLEFKEDAEHEIQRYVDKGFAVVKPLKWAQDTFEKGTVSKLACITKIKEDKTKKVRIIVDLLRSHGNARCKVPERIVLPRATDVVEMARQLDRQGDQLWRELSPGDEVAEGWDMEIVMIDLSDAFCHFPIHRSELRHAVAPGVDPGTVVVFTAMLFGFKSLLRHRDGALQLYVDDAIVLLNGTRAHRDEKLALLLHTAAGMGIQISYHKGERGRKTTWIGIQFEIDVAEAAMVLSIPKKMLAELKAALEEWKNKGMVGLRQLRSFTGRASWLAGVLFRWRWVVSIMYAVIASHEKDVRSGEERRRAQNREDTRCKENLVPVKRLELPVAYLTEAIELASVHLIRKEPLEVKEPTMGIVTDACPTGIGAVLVVRRSSGRLKPIGAFYAPVTQREAEMLNVPFEKSDSQSALEAYALLRAMHRWRGKLKGASFFIKSDSTVALAITRKLSSGTPTLNFLGAEMSLELASMDSGALKLIHTPGQLNEEADWLSRLPGKGDKNDPPAALRQLHIEEFRCPEDFAVFHL